jgi:hypothetical protein
MELARGAPDARARPRFLVLRTCVPYIQDSPAPRHPPTVPDHLFARRAAPAPEARLLVDELRAEHEEGARLIRELERALVLMEEAWPLRAREFQQAVDAYAEFHWKHMRKEEQQLLPLAERHLLPEDWNAIDAAFAANRDPIAGVQERDFDQLFSRIVSLAPQPVGLGDRWSGT